LKHVLALALIVAVSTGCATAQDSKGTVAAPAAAACAAPPKELVVKDLQPGTGQQEVKYRSAVLVAYTGWLYDGCAKDLKGAKFDSSEGRPAPFGFMVGTGRVIKGWDEGVIGMKEKGKRLLVIPPDKGYGERGSGSVIPPNSALVFEVDLERIVYQPPEAAPQK
jgi:FKBP-type peptidyl-prolyl cis-trans isomerase FkpA